VYFGTVLLVCWKPAVSFFKVDILVNLYHQIMHCNSLEESSVQRITEE
jgi:hypothetical protein